MSKIYKSLSYSVSSKYINRAINLASIVLVARLLTPAELGLYAIAASIYLIAGELRTFGASNYLIRERTLDRPVIASALGLSMLIAWSMGLLLLLSAPWIEDFYAKPDIAPMLQALAISFFLSPHISIGKALMAREFDFRRLFIIEVTTQAGLFISIITLILLQYSYFSLAYGQVIAIVIELFMVVLFRTRDFTFLPQLGQVRKIANFGVVVTAAYLLRKMTDNLTDLIIGKLGTAEQVAFFSRATGFLNFLTMSIESGIRPVVDPYFSDKARRNHDLNAAYLRASVLLGAMTVPALAVAGYASEPVILFFFGPQWTFSAGLVSILCFAFMIRVSYSLSSSLFIIAKLEKFFLYKEIFGITATATSIYVLFPYGLDRVAEGIVGVALGEFLLVALIFIRRLGMSPADIAASILPNLVLAAACAGWAALLDSLMDFSGMPPVLVVAVLTVTCAAVWLAIILVTRHPMQEELKLLYGKLRRSRPADDTPR
ncbi:MAG TPA: hypothetical protein ENI93_02190 [Gammaproteobacteria bacterium]|nr:hypothetical protein [Gammaproteobacteria bacterium]